MMKSSFQGSLRTLIKVSKEPTGILKCGEMPGIQSCGPTMDGRSEYNMLLKIDKLENC